MMRQCSPSLLILVNSPPLVPPIAMDSPSSNFQSILDSALKNYSKQTGIDITNHSSAERLQNCYSPDDVIQLLSERESEFNNYRDKYRKLMHSLRPVVEVVHAFSSVIGEVAALVSNLHSIIALISQYLTPLSRCHFNRPRRYLPELIFSFRYAHFPLHQSSD
jgi:hypothetical protein